MHFALFVFFLCALAGCEESQESKQNTSGNGVFLNSYESSLYESETTDEVTFVIVDKRGDDWADMEDRFFQDEKYYYCFGGWPMHEYVIVEYSDGTSQNIKEALLDGNITITDLDRFGIKYYREPHDEKILAFDWDFYKHWQVYHGCYSYFVDAMDYPFVSGVAYATTWRCENEYDINLLYTAELFISRFDADTKNSMCDKYMFNESEIGEVNAWLESIGIVAQQKPSSVFVWSDESMDNAIHRQIDYTFFHCDLSPADMEKLVKMGRENGYHIRINLCEDEKCFEGKAVFIPDECLFHSGDEGPDHCPDKN